MNLQEYIEKSFPQPEKRFLYEIQKERINQRMTQLDLAKKMKSKQSLISRIERGGTSPTLRTMQRMAKALGLNLEITLIKNL